ncbi:hypothetical protein GT002_41055, partial [Streptomyces sp. SID4917]|nr:hypothetical protein [Streptomyces sp. SID4917]
PDWWAQPRTFEEPDADEHDEPPTPYRAELAGTWRDGPAPWNDASGSVPAGGSPHGGGSPYGPDSAGPFGTGSAGGTGTGQGGEIVMARGGDTPYSGPGSGRSGGGGWPSGGASDALRADAQRETA